MDRHDDTPKWRPIETAPKDGRRVLGYFPEMRDEIQIMRFDAPTSGHKPHWNVGRMTLAEPMYWMPLPWIPGPGMIRG